MRSGETAGVPSNSNKLSLINRASPNKVAYGLIHSFEEPNKSFVDHERVKKHGVYHGVHQTKSTSKR